MKVVPLPLVVWFGMAFAPLAVTTRAGVVEDWNEAFLKAVRKEAPPPCLVSRNLPIFHLSIHRAVQAAAKAGLDRRTQECVAFKAAEAAYRAFFPSQTAIIEPLRLKHRCDQPLEKAWAKMADHAVKACFKEREDDGSSTTVHYIPSDKPGQWRRTPPNFRPPEFPHWGKVRPYVLKDVAKFRAPPPPALGSEEFAADLNEVKALGSKTSTLRTAEQTMIARFWSDFSYTTSPAGHWNDIARSLSLERKLGVAEAARLFAILDVTLADTCIAIWDTKYHYNYWRPVTAIQRADEDGNEATEQDKTWMSMLPSPPHPDYVSGHSGISGAAATILEHFFGRKNISFVAESDDVKDMKRHFTSFAECAQEIARSRVYGGIHYTSAGREGLRMGDAIAKAVLVRFEEVSDQIRKAAVKD